MYMADMQNVCISFCLDADHKVWFCGRIWNGIIYLIGNMILITASPSESPKNSIKTTKK